MSANSGAEVFNSVLVTGQSPAGDPITEARGAAPGSLLLPFVGAAPTAVNPSAATSAAGWTTFGPGVLTWDTTTFFTGPGSIKASDSRGNIFSSDIFQTVLNAGYTFRAGLTYALSVRMQTTLAGVAGTLLFGDNNWPVTGFAAGATFPSMVRGNYARTDIPSITTAFSEYVVYWTPRQDIDSGNVGMRYVAGSGSAFPPAIWFDEVAIFRTGSTIVDRRGFKRTMQLPVNSSLPADGIASAQIGDVWLQSHKTTPFRGTVTLVGDESLRHITTGRNVGLEELLLNTTELLRFSDRTDPDTGGHGRDGRIAAVSYTPATNTATVTIDNSRTSFEALLARLALIQGG
jgi:hypothetical protein